MKVERWSQEQDGPLTEQALRRTLEGRGYRVARYDYPPGTRFSSHTHEVDKIDAVLSGRFRVTMEGRSVVLEAGDAVFVPRGTPHSAEVVGGETVVSLDATRRGWRGEASAAERGSREGGAPSWRSSRTGSGSPRRATTTSST